MIDKNMRWQPQPAADAAYRAALGNALTGCPSAARFADQLLASTGVRLRDIVDHLALPPEALARLGGAGWRERDGVWRNRDGTFPPAIAAERLTVWLRVEEIEQFTRATGSDLVIEGQPFAPLRRAIAFSGPGARFGVIERNGDPGFEVVETDGATLRAARLHFQTFKARRREFDTVEQGLAHTERLVDAAVDDIGAHRACDLWLKAERDYWMKRCASGRLQKARQDAAGIGWANIDHHTYDGSRRHFSHTIRILEKLGYELREMLYAGELAGWGSQVLEQPVIGSTIFADVDLAPHELAIDFAHGALPDLPKHRRAGLLSELLGESILEAGLNHVAALYDQKLLRAQLEGEGLTMMAPFSDMPYLYQELTSGDWAAVDPARVDRLEAAGQIGPEEAEKLRLEGSIVAHLENIERNAGFKGFNREGIDAVLRKLDPRAYHSNEAAA